MNRKVLVLGILILVAVGVGAVYYLTPGLLSDGDAPKASIPETDERTTGTTTPPPTEETTTTGSPSSNETTSTAVNGSGSGSGNYGLLPVWEAKYDGTCASCHMKGKTLHTAPFHPTEAVTEEQATWKFLDDDVQAAPNVALPNPQDSGITLEGQRLHCGDCHTVSNPAGFADPANAEPTRDPHAVHRGVIRDIGCLRCHDGSANTETASVNEPIDMRDSESGTLLSTHEEAPFAGPSGGPNGTGWTKYMDASSPDVTEGSCGDCHGRYHAEGNLSFTFDRETRVGPAADIPSGGAGIKMGESTLGCEACHAAGVHTVHTNGKMSSTFQLTRREGAKGAESCLVCHGVGVAKSYRGHFNPDTAERLGLLGDVDIEPDATGYNLTDGDCGFCHLRNP